MLREAVIKASPSQLDTPGAVFIPHFHLAGMSPGRNILFSFVPIPFITELPGFRSKRWMIDKTTGDFSGYYEWDTEQDAEAYAKSFATRFMARRSLPESVWFEVSGRCGPAAAGEAGVRHSTDGCLRR